MRRAARRRLTLADLIILIVATAVRLAWGSAAWPSLFETWFGAPRNGWTFFAMLCVMPNALVMACPLLVTYTLTLLGLRKATG